VVAGAAAWVLAAFACLVVLWGAGRRVRAGSGGHGDGRPPAPMVPIASSPLVTGMVVAMVVSLIVAG